jgi:hypothetical protein
MEVAFSKYDATAKEVLGACKAVYVSGSEEVKLAKADSEDTVPCNGFTEYSVTTDAKVTVFTNDMLEGFSSLTPGSEYFLSQSTAGEITSTKPTTGIIISVGVALTATKLDIHITRLDSPTAIHKSTSAEISTITEKTTPVDNDLLLIEDSAASNAKKKVKIVNLPGASSEDVVLKVKASDESVVSSETYQYDDDLYLDITSGETWLFEIVLHATEESNNPNIKLKISAINGLTGDVQYGWHVCGTSTGGQQRQFTTVMGAVSLAMVPYTAIIITGAVKATATGRMQLEWAQDTSDTDATIVKALSKLIAHKIS